MAIPSGTAHTRKTIGREKSRAQLGYTNNDVAMKQNTVVVIGLCGGNKEGTGQELLAPTQAIRPSNGWNLNRTTIPAINKDIWSNTILRY